MLRGSRGPITHKPSRPVPVDLAALDDGALMAHCQTLYGRLDDGYAKCDQAPDDATRHKWEAAWLALLGQYERAVDELRVRTAEEARRRGLPAKEAK